MWFYKYFIILENFAIGSYIQEDVIGDFHLMVEDFYWEQCLIMTRKNSVLLPLLDEFILRVFESGLVGYWQNEVTTTFRYLKKNSWVLKIISLFKIIPVTLKWYFLSLEYLSWIYLNINSKPYIAPKIQFGVFCG